MAKILISLGLIFIVSGVLWHFGLLKWAGHLPGDIRIEKENFKFYFPFVTCIVLSLMVTFILRLIQYFSK